MSKFFINRPIVAMVISILMVVIGLVTIAQLPIAQFPQIAPPEVQIRATYVGADAQTIEQSVATPIEQQMSGVDNLNYMYSLNAAGNGQMTMIVDFDVKTDPNTDLMLTQLRETQAQSQLPQDVTNFGVTVQKSVTAPLMVMGLYSPKGTYDGKFLANYSYINLNDQLTRVPGIGNVQVFGAGQYAMRLWIKPDQLSKLSITVTDVVNAIQAQNTVNPAGQVGGAPSPKGQEYTYSVRAQGRLTSPEQFGDIIVRELPDGGIVRVRDVARIELGSQDYTLDGRINGKPGAIIAVYQLPGSNAVDAARGVRKVLEEARKRFPNDVDYVVSLDTTESVTEGMKDIFVTILIAIALVTIVVYLFLQGWRATLIPLLAVPVSLIGTFIMFPVFGFTINTLSLFGLVLAIGLVVDDAIVVVEAVERHIEEGMDPKSAAVKAMEEISGPVIGIALVLSAVFVPTVFIPGITGRLYQQFAVTIAISVILSAFNALTLSPALAALLLKPASHRSQSKKNGWRQRFFDGFNRLFARVTDGYIHWSGVLIRKSAVAMAVLLVAGAGAAFLSNHVPASFLPGEDQGYLFMHLQLPNASSLERTEAASEKVEQILLHTPGVKYTTRVAGFSLLSFVSTSYTGFFFVTLDPWSERTSRQTQYNQIVQHVNQELVKLPDGFALSFPPPAIPGVGTSGGFTFVLEDRAGKDVQFLADNLQKFTAAASKRPEIAPGLVSTFLPSVPQQFLDVDREKVLKQGVALGDVYRTVQAYMGGLFVNYFNRFGRQWQVYVEAEGEYRKNLDYLDQFYVRNSKGEMVPLSALTHFESRPGPEFTMRYNLYRSAQIIGGAAPGYSSAQAMKALEETFDQTMPREMGYDYLGMSYQEKKAQEGVPVWAIFSFSLLFVFLILAALYESWTLPFSVLLSTPIAIFGAFGMLWLRRWLMGLFLPPYMIQVENDVYSQIGLVMLIGLAAKNAILIVEFAKDKFESGMRLADAALEGARLRLRPILMTSFAFILGCVPLWTASGAGSVGRQIMGTTVIGGMLAASAIGIFFIPAIFYIVEKVSGAGNREPGDASRSRARRLIMRYSLAVATAAAIFLTGCAVGPNYVRPTVQVPADFRAPEPLPSSDAASLADEKWFEVFKDERLQDLIHKALKDNYDLRDAVARVEQARANLGITHANQLPQLSAGGDLNFTRLSRDGSLPLPASFVPSQNRNWGEGALNLLSFEVDIWGRLRRATEAARANLLNAEENRKAVVTTLVSDVATNYFDLLQLDYDLQISESTLETRRESLLLTQQRQGGGVATLLDLRQAEQLVSTAAETIPTLQQQIEQKENQINLLLGKNPGEVTRGRSFLEQELPPDVPAGLPSALLERRPDIRAGEQALIAANANIGVAKAAYFPQLSLSGLLGGQSTQLASLFSGPHSVWSFVPQVSQPIFAGGRLKSGVKLAEAERESALVQYQKSVQTAFAEVSNALIAHQRTRESRLEEERLVLALQDRKRLAYVRYRGGVDTQLNALDADRDLFQAELDLAQIRLNELLSVVQLYKALGGGWQ